MATKDITDKQVCAAYNMYWAENHVKWPYKYLQDWTGEPMKVCYSAMERAEKRRYIDYGVSLRSGWLTEKGKKLLEEEDKDKREQGVGLSGI